MYLYKIWLTIKRVIDHVLVRCKGQIVFMDEPHSININDIKV